MPKVTIVQMEKGIRLTLELLREAVSEWQWRKNKGMASFSPSEEIFLKLLC